MGGFVNGHWNDSITAEEAALRDSGSGQPAAPPPVRSNTSSAPSTAPVPAPASLLTNPATGQPYDFNNQSDRADYRTNTGGYIDNTGVYAPGAGDRVGDTWSGANANRNEAPSPTRLPVLNGTPVSPSNGFTGDQTGAIMYRGDPLYNQYFGPDTPGYSSTSRTYNATPGALPEGQGAIGDYWQQHGQSSTGIPAAPAPTSTPNAPAAGVPAPSALGAQPPASGSDPAWLAGVTGQNPSGGYGPYQTADVPQLTSQGQYNDNGRLIEKSTDQYGHEYFRQVGTAPATNAPTTPKTPTGTAPESTTPSTDPTKGGTLVPLLTGDGKVIYVPQAIYDQHKADIDAQAAAAAKAIAFNQGIEQQKVDVSRLIAQYTKAYQDALIQNASVAQAQQAAYQAMQIDLQKQAQELQRQQQAQQYSLAQQSQDTTRQQNAQTLSLEREKLDLQRQQQRGRHGAPVRFA